jgi:hypothetical protein
MRVNDEIRGRATEGKGKDPEKPETAVFVRVKGPCGLCGVGRYHTTWEKNKEKKREKREKTRDDDDVPVTHPKRTPKNERKKEKFNPNTQTRRRQQQASGWPDPALALNTHHLPSPNRPRPTVELGYSRIPDLLRERQCRLITCVPRGEGRG